MADTKYRFRLPNGEEYESTMTPAAIRKAHPEAVITHRVTVLDNGEAEMHVYGGQQTSEPDVVSEDAVVDSVPVKSAGDVKVAPKDTRGR